VPKYLLEGNYTVEGVKGLQAEGGSARLAAATALVEGLGGSVDGFYYAFGDTDIYFIVDMPDAASAAAMSLAVNAGGGLTARTQVLMTTAELDAAADKKTTYRPPGR
jgi:uncharacterized protein with GYD domain